MRQATVWRSLLLNENELRKHWIYAFNNHGEIYLSMIKVENTDMARNHDDVIKWKHFPRYWTFVKGIHQSPVNSLHKGHRREALIFYVRLHKQLSKPSWGWRFETPMRSLWRHCNAFLASWSIQYCYVLSYHGYTIRSDWIRSFYLPIIIKVAFFDGAIVRIMCISF